MTEGDKGFRGSRLEPPLPASEPMDGVGNSSGSRQWSSGGSRRSRLGPTPSPRISALQSTASFEPSSSGSTGVLAYQVHTGSVQNDILVSSSDSRCGSPSSSLLRRGEERAVATHYRQQSSSNRSSRWKSRSNVPWWKRLGRTCRKRVPRGVGSFVVFLLNVVESFAFYVAIDSTLRILFNGSDVQETALVLLVKFTLGRVLYPVAGVVSDVYTGRYKMIQIGIGMFWIAFAILSLTLGLAAGGIYNHTITKYVLPVVAFALISAGSGAIEVAIIPFGVDQLSQGASSDEQSSYFYVYYFGRQLGYLLGMFTFYGLNLIWRDSGEDGNEHKESLYAVASIQSTVALAGFTIAIALMWWFKQQLFIDRKRENPLKEVANVVCYAATVRDTPPISRRAFRYGEGKKKRMEKAKRRYDGPYTSEKVEDVKTFCKILLVLFSLGLCFMTYTGVDIMLEYEIRKYQQELQILLYYANGVTLWNSLALLLYLPVLNFIVLPCLPSWTMRERIGFGVAITALAAILAAYLEWCIFPLVLSEQKFLWLILPTAVMSLGEMLLFVTGLEFIYAQSPEQMKGLLTGLFYLMFGLFSGAASLFFFKFPFKIEVFPSHACYFVIYGVVGGIGFLMYMVVACLYSNRDRPEEGDSEYLH